MNDSGIPDEVKFK